MIMFQPFIFQGCIYSCLFQPLPTGFHVGRLGFRYTLPFQLLDAIFAAVGNPWMDDGRNPGGTYGPRTTSTTTMKPLRGPASTSATDATYVID